HHAMARGESKGGKAESWMAGLRKYAGDFLRRSREALEAGFIHLASTCPVTWRCWMRHVSLHPSSFALPPGLRPRSNGRKRMPRQNRLRPAPRSHRKSSRRAMGEEGGGSFDHLVGAGEQRRRDGEAECLSRGQIDNEIEFGRLLDRKIARLCTTKNFIDILASTPEQVRKIRCIRHQTSRFDEFPKTVHCRQSCGYRQSIDPNAIGVHEGVAHDVKRIRARLDRLEGRVNIVRSSNLERGEFESERASG